MKSYWFCLVEVDIPDHEMPYGADSPMRDSVVSAIESLHDDAIIGQISSGWGLSADGAEAVITESCQERNCISRDVLLKRDQKPQQAGATQ